MLNEDHSQSWRKLAQSKFIELRYWIISIIIILVYVI